ncbi:MAG: TolC family protein [Candidatus Latescibacterota bacterium]|nr:MAG: TolC family protein [Candidatus Latescibacterota bacterium]
MKRLVVGFLISIAAAGPSHGQTVTMESYLNKVRLRHPYFASEQLQPAIEAKNRDSYLGRQDWVATSSAYFAYQRPLSNSAFAPEETYAAGIDAGLERTFWGTGGQFAIFWESRATDQRLPEIVIPGGPNDIAIPIGPQRFYENRIYARYSQPLLQDRGGLLNRLEYELADYNINFAEVQSLENQENFLLDVALLYLDWVMIVEEHRISNERLKFAEEQLDQITRRRDAYLVDDVDVLRAQDALQVAKQAVVRNESQFIARRAELAVLVQDNGLNELFPEFDIYEEATLPTADDAIADIQHQRIVRALTVRLGQLSHQKVGFQETTKAQLYLNLAGGVQEGDRLYFEALNLDRPEVSVSLDFRYPLGNRTARNDVAKTNLEIRQLEEQIKSVSIDLEAEIRKILIQIDELVKIMALNREQIETAREKTKAEQERYEQGRGALNFVIQSRDDEFIAQLRLAINAATYHQLVLTYRALADELLPNS